jgi:class 3 adenylate cyclase
MISDQTNRTFICSVVFVDLVGYSKLPVSEQLSIKDRFTALLGDSLKNISVNNRIVLDTGDGAAMSFLGDPEDALYVGMSLRNFLKPGVADETLSGTTLPGTDTGGIRIGINLGPVKLVKDINGHPNIVGDGINVSQRIMSFARPGQVLVSRSYYEVVSCMSEEYAKLFTFDGSRTDKHVREHEVYVVGESETAFTRAKTGTESRATGSGPRPAYEQGAEDSGDKRAALSAASLKLSAMAFIQDRRKVMIASAALGAIVLLLAGLLLARKSAPPPHATAAQAGAVAPAADANMAAPVAAPAPSPATAAAAKPETVKKEAPQPQIPPGSVNLFITPWGEIYINGKQRGLSPPVKTLKLAPGKYKIEIRNSNLTPYADTIEIKSREELTIRHTFK